jgi:hypothetical protein
MPVLENWKRRAEMINYCVNIVDQSMEEKRKSFTSEEGDARAERKAQAAIFADEVKVIRKVLARATPFLINLCSEKSSSQ